MSVVIDRDRGFRAMLRRMLRIRHGPSVTVGVQGSDAAEDRDGITNAELATIHEFGAPGANIPQRSFIRGTVDRERQKIQRLLDRAVRSGVSRGDVLRQLGIVGEAVKGEMVRTIDQTIGLAPNTLATEAAKGSTKPLIDIGVLKAAISYKVHP